MSTMKTASAAIIAILMVIVMAGLLLKASVLGPVDQPLSPNPGDYLWDARDFETILQGLLILGGVFAILMLLRTSRREAIR